MNTTSVSRNRYGRNLITACVLLLVVSCAKNEDPQPAEMVKTFYEKLFQLVEQNSINRRDIDWPAYKAAVLAKVGSAKTVPDTEPAMTLALALLKDNHSSIVAEGKRYLYSGVGCAGLPTVSPSSSFSEPNMGYILINGFSGSDPEAANLAQDIQNDLARQDSKNPKGWIVDLRRNTGGNMWPMVAGLGPIIGEGTCGYFYDVDNKPLFPFAYKSGGSLLNGSIQTQVAKPYQLQRTNPKVAVLISGATASSGEATALAFAGRPNTRFFGAATCGLSTSNLQYDLPYYGYVLNLTTAKLGDRTGKVYGKAIMPDEAVANEQAVSKAIEWINQ